MLRCERESVCERERENEAGGMASGVLNVTEPESRETNDQWAMRHWQSNSARGAEILIETMGGKSARGLRMQRRNTRLRHHVYSTLYRGAREEERRIRRLTGFWCAHTVDHRVGEWGFLLSSTYIVFASLSFCPFFFWFHRQDYPALVLLTGEKSAC